MGGVGGKLGDCGAGGNSGHGGLGGRGGGRGVLDGGRGGDGRLGGRGSRGPRGCAGGQVSGGEGGRGGGLRGCVPQVGQHVEFSGWNEYLATARFVSNASAKFLWGAKLGGGKADAGIEVWTRRSGHAGAGAAAAQPCTPGSVSVSMTTPSSVLHTTPRLQQPRDVPAARADVHADLGALADEAQPGQVVGGQRGHARREVVKA